MMTYSERERELTFAKMLQCGHLILNAGLVRAVVITDHYNLMHCYPTWAVEF